MSATVVIVATTDNDSIEEVQHQLDRAVVRNGAAQNGLWNLKATHYRTDSGVISTPDGPGMGDVTVETLLASPAPGEITISPEVRDTIERLRSATEAAQAALAALGG